jgi:hypothetical protein
MAPLYDLRKKLEIYTVGILVLIALSYGLFRAYPLLMGPSIKVISPLEGDVVASTTFQVSGEVKRANSITLQGRPITVDVDGRFVETLVTYYPYTILVLTATDGYGKTITKTIKITGE